MHLFKVMRQPGDGSCLFHSMSYGLGSGINASRLRSEICTFIQNNPELKISDTPLKVRSCTFQRTYCHHTTISLSIPTTSTFAHTYCHHLNELFIYTCIHTNTYIHRCIYIYKHAYIYSIYVHKYIHTYIHTYLRNTLYIHA